MLLPESRRKKVIGVKEVEDVVAKMARIPSKSVSKDDTEALKTLEGDLEPRGLGQDKAIHALASRDQAGARRPAPAGKAHRLLSVLRPHRRRQDRSRQAARHASWAWNSCAST